MIWREKRILLILLAVILAANAMFFFTYRVQYKSRLEALDTRLDDVQRELSQARAARVKAEQAFAGYRKVEGDVLEVFNEHWSTQEERFTQLVAEVKRLAVASSLVPDSYSFARGSTKRVSTGNSRETLGASEVQITFGVKGTYDQARRLINLLELSRQFVIIEGISLSSGDGNELALALRLKTLFRDEQPGADRTRGRSANRL
jgi:Tfp pilus assembly protein PilO